MNMADLSIKRPILVSMVLIVFVLFGVLSFFNMNLQFLPDTALPMVTVRTVYPGANSEEIQLQVTKPIEDAVSAVSEIDSIQSYSMENASFIMISFHLGKDVYVALDEVKDKVDGIIGDLPDDAENPLVQRFDPLSVPVVDLSLSGSIPATTLYDLADKKLKNRFSQIKGVADVTLTGGRKREVRVEIDSRELQQNGLSLRQLAGILAMNNLDMPGGNIQPGNMDVSVRLQGRFQSLEQLRALEVPTPFGLKKLSDMATIKDAYKPVRKQATYFNNQAQRGASDAILISLRKTSGSNEVRTYNEVVKALPEIREFLPSGCSLELINESITYTRDSVKDTLINIGLGILFTALILFFFLHDLRSTFIVALSMPMSIFSAFLFMRMSGFSMNMLTLMGLSTSVGILVTNSVVVLENIFRHKNRGLDSAHSALRGTREVAMAVLASAGTNLVVFLPLSTMITIAGIMFRNFSLTVVYATLFSLLMSFTLTPMLASMILPDKPTRKFGISEKMEEVFIFLETIYRKILLFFLQKRLRGATFILAAFVLFLSSLFAAGNIGFEFIPDTDDGHLTIKVDMPTGAKLSDTARTAAEIEARLQRIPEISRFWTTLGTQSLVYEGVEMMLTNVKLVDVDERSFSTKDLVSRLHEDLANIPNARIRVAPLRSLGGGNVVDIDLQLQGQDLDVLEGYSRELLQKMKSIPGLINADSSSRRGKPELTIIPDNPKLARAGLTTTDLAVAVRAAVDGLVATQYRDKGEEYDIRVALSEEATDTPEEIANIAVFSRQGRYTLGQLATIEFGEGRNMILGKDRYKSIRLTGAVAQGYVLGAISDQLDAAIAGLNLPAGYKVRWGMMVEEMDKTVSAIIRAFVIALILTYMLLAGILESLVQPLYILGTIPLSLIGVFYFLALTGSTMNIVSMLAIVMLIGIVVNNAILLLDYTNQLVREKGEKVRDALLTACPARLKAILMSTIAIILGMLPMAAGIGASGRELRQPMGIVSIGGVLVSAVFTLVLIPVLYDMLSGKIKQKTLAGALKEN
ncbi:MAG TPA: efflux RND transporter permease subunit [Candidatus Aminicenantes bacterium]|nr:efflux RND transporter permease subunit [Candidatus Aminicenantes bacterium]